MMQVIYGIENVHAEWPASVVCAGTFDGVHLGHREVIGRAAARAKAQGLPCVVVTFDRNPAAFLAPDKLRPAIASPSANLVRIAGLGVNLAVVLPFDERLAFTTAEQFCDEFLVGRLRASQAVVGHDFTFGKDRKGTPEWLHTRIETEIVPPFVMDGQRVGSSHIRNLVENGDIEAANRLLGWEFEIEGVVVGGQKLGRTMGFPTVNLARSFAQITPADGVYAGLCRHSGLVYQAAISVGVRPTVDDLRTIEAYLIEYRGPDLYGENLTLALSQRLRGPMKFDSVEELKEQIASDVLKVSSVN